MEQAAKACLSGRAREAAPVRGPPGAAGINLPLPGIHHQWAQVSDLAKVRRSQPFAPDGNDPDWRRFETEALPHVDRLFRLAMWLERNRSEAEDLVQETLAQALQSFHRFTPGTNCRAWLISILQHLRSNRRRAQGRAPLDVAVEERAAHTLPFIPPIPEHLTDEDLLQALGQLSLPHQEVILLCDVHEMTYKEIADALGIPIGTVMSRLHRGRELLRVALTSNSAQSATAREGC